MNQRQTLINQAAAPPLQGLPVQPESILVRATNWVGDVVMSLPALEALRELYPQSRITVLARPWVKELLSSHPAVDEVWEYAKGGERLRDFTAVWRAAKRVREGDFAMAVLFQNAFEAGLISRLGRVPVRVGYDTDGRRLLLSHPVSRKTAPKGAHQVAYYLNIIRAMGWDGEERDPGLHVTGTDREQARRLFEAEKVARERRIVGMAPGAAFGPAKRWPAERFAEIADRAATEWGAGILILGSAGDRESCRAVAAAMRHTPVDLCGRTGLSEAVAVIDACDLFLTNDSGLMHVSAALGVPTVAVFGSTDPVATGPRGPHSRVVRNPVECSPCLRPVCPEDYRCMLGISPDKVWEAACALVRS
ncbi:MAG: lipopolysaccharide heptosyltransferase II [Thermodesulfobacteriota bacterium]